MLKKLRNVGASFAAGFGAALLLAYLTSSSNVKVPLFAGVLVLGAAVAYATFFAKKTSPLKAVFNLGRNIIAALVTGFIFTIATSSYYSNVGNILYVSGFERAAFYSYLMNEILPLWFAVAFVMMTVLSALQSTRPIIAGSVDDFCFSKSILAELPTRFEDKVPIAKFPFAFLTGCVVFCALLVWILVSMGALAAF